MTVFELQIGLQAISTYRRMDYEYWYALAEFVDNATQSYLNNRDVLDVDYAEKGDELEVRITLDRENSVFRIADNAMGMDKADLDRALEIAVPPPNPNGRSRYGMGLKTAACWIGNRWSIKTKKLGDPLEYTVEVDVDRVASGAALLESHEAEVEDLSDHYTIIEIRDLNRPFKGRTVGKTKDYLRSMYRQDIRSGMLALYYAADRLTWEGFDHLLLRNRAGEPFKRDFTFTVNGKNVHGWVGVLETGDRAQAGFSIFHFGRVIRAAPTAWRPEKIFGTNRNDLLNQRLVGEIHLDEFEVTHTKDNIQWFGDEDEKLEAELKKHIAAEVAEARRTKKSRTAARVDERGPSEQDVSIAIAAMRRELLSPEMVDRLSLTMLPPEEVVREQLESIARPVKVAQEPDVVARIGDMTVWVFVASDDMSSFDPYVIQQSGEGNKLIVIVNMQHPYVSRMSGEQFEYHLRECIFDAIAEFKAQSLRMKLDADSVKLIKDVLLRVPLQVEEHEIVEDTTEEDVDAGVTDEIEVLS